jgi:hypothetical protein
MYIAYMGEGCGWGGGGVVCFEGGRGDGYRASILF